MKSLRLQVAVATAALLACAPNGGAQTRQSESRFNDEVYSNRVQMHGAPFSLTPPEEPGQQELPGRWAAPTARVQMHEPPFVVELPSESVTDGPGTRGLRRPAEDLPPDFGPPEMVEPPPTKPPKKKNWILPPQAEDAKTSAATQPSGWGWLADSVMEAQRKAAADQEEARAEEASAGETEVQRPRAAASGWAPEGRWREDTDRAGATAGDTSADRLQQRDRETYLAERSAEVRVLDLGRQRDEASRILAGRDGWRREGMQIAPAPETSLGSDGWRSFGRGDQAAAASYGSPPQAAGPAQDAMSVFTPLPTAEIPLGLTPSAADMPALLLTPDMGFGQSALGGSETPEFGPLRSLPDDGFGLDRTPNERGGTLGFSASGLESFGTRHDVWSVTPGATE